MGKTIAITLLLTFLFLPFWCMLWTKLAEYLADKYDIDEFLIYFFGSILLPGFSALFLIIKYL